MRAVLVPRVVAGLAAVPFVGRPAAAQRYVAPTNETVTSTTEESQSESPVHVIYVENRSTVPITVFSVSLNGCENVRQSCGPRPVRLRIGPGRREVAARVEPASRDRGFTYYFRFSWHPDSGGTAALAALAAAGSTHAKEQLAGIRHADSLDRAGAGPHELTRDDFTALAGRSLLLRAVPDSLVLAPGDRTTVERLGVVVADSQGTILGRTRVLRWRVPTNGTLQFVPPDQIVARAPGRAVLHFQLGEQAQALVQRPVEELDYAVRVAYPADPHAPTFDGVAVDADRHTPLACADVALEDSADNVVARGRTSAGGAFHLPAPRPGTYRVRVETFGWAPAPGPAELAAADARVAHEYPVRFTEQLLTPRGLADPDEFRHAYPAAVTAVAVDPPRASARGAHAAAVPVVNAVTMGGSESAPVLGIVGRVPAGSAWMQFVVDSLGHVDPASVALPPGAAPAATASVLAVLPRVRFAPARAAGRPTCELLRMQVTFVPR